MPNEPIARIDDLVRAVEFLKDPAARQAAVELVQAVMGLHEAALRRILETIGAAGNGASVLDSLASDDLVSGVLALHSLHPESAEARVNRAMEKLHRYFDSRGAGIVLVEMDAESLRVRCTGTRPGAGERAKQIIEETICEAAPEISRIVIEGLEEPRDPGFVPLAELVAAGRP